MKEQLLIEKQPLIDERYYCASCGNVGEEDPDTGLCFKCGADDWEVVKGKEHEIGY